MRQSVNCGVRTICPKSIGPMPNCPILTCPALQFVLCQIAQHDDIFFLQFCPILSTFTSVFVVQNENQ